MKIRLTTSHVTPFFPLTAALWLALLACSLFSLGGCSAPPVKQIVLKGQSRTAPSHFYPQSLRLAARGNVQSRAGDDALAAEYFRAAYHAHPDIRYLLRYARSCERARFFNEAQMAYADALNHDLSDADRKRVAAEVERLQTLVSQQKAPITLQVRPRTARAIVSRPALKGDPRSKPFQRIVMGDAKIFLQPGQYQLHASARGFRGELRSFRLKAGSERGQQGQLMAISLMPDEKVPLVVAQHETATLIGGKSGRRKPRANQRAERRASGDAEAASTGEDDDDDDDEDEDEETKKQQDAKRVASADRETDESPDDEEADEVEEDAADEVVSSSVSGGGGLHKWGPIATTGLGVLALGGGGALWYLALQEADAAQGVNPSAANRQEIFDFHKNQAELYWNMRIVAFGVGGALVAAGTIWMAVAPKRVASAAREDGLADVLRPQSLQFNGTSVGATWRF